jgi:16S rRNA U516 pseudouridylate synthase RsuA-like enzyme
MFRTLFFGLLNVLFVCRKYQFILTEGRNRQIRKMVEAVGLEVKELHRSSFSGITTEGETPVEDINDDNVGLILVFLRS